MVQNRKRTIKLFIGNLSNYVVHKVLEGAINDENIRKHYEKEYDLSFKISSEYREKLNPINNLLPDKDIAVINRGINKKSKAELRLRIRKGYKNINLEKVDAITEKILKKLKVM